MISEALTVSTIKASMVIGSVVYATYTAVLAASDSTTLGLGALATLGTLGAAWLAARQSRGARREDRAEYLISTLMERVETLEGGAISSRDLLKALDDQVADLTKEKLGQELANARLADRNERQADVIRALVAQIEEAGMSPAIEVE